MQNETRSLCLGLFFLGLGVVIFVSCNEFCGTNQRRRGNLCCLEEICEDTDFIGCVVNNTKDKCIPCPKGYYLSGKYSTSNFQDPGENCALIPECASDEVRNADGECECDREKEYYLDKGICTLTLISCIEAGYELSLSGKCQPCLPGYFKPSASTALCKKKTEISCFANQTVEEGDTKTDLSCRDQETTTPLMTTTTISHGLPKDTNGLNPTNIGLIAGGVFCIIVLIVGALIWCKCRKCTNIKKKETDPEQSPLQNISIQGGNTAREQVEHVSENVPLRSEAEDKSQKDNSSTRSVDPEGAVGGTSYSKTEDFSETFVKEVHGRNSSHNSDSSTEHANSEELQAPRTLNQQPVSDDPGMILPGGQNSFNLFPNGIAPNHQDAQIIEHEHDSGFPSEEPNHRCGHPSH